jgi:hypothetical protein
MISIIINIHSESWPATEVIDVAESIFQDNNNTPTNQTRVGFKKRITNVVSFSTLRSLGHDKLI